MDDDELAEYRSKHRQAYLKRKCQNYGPREAVPPPAVAPQRAPAPEMPVTKTIWPTEPAPRPTPAPSGARQPLPPPREISSRVVSKWQLPGAPAVVSAPPTGSTLLRRKPPHDQSAPLLTNAQSPLQTSQSVKQTSKRDVLYNQSSPSQQDSSSPAQISDEQLARKLQEAEDEELARQLAAGSAGAFPDLRAPDTMYTERLIGGVAAATAPGRSPPTMTRSLLGHDARGAQHNAPINNLSAAQATVVEGVRNVFRQSPLSPSSHRSTPPNLSEMDEEEQLRWAMEESKREFHARK